MFIFLLYTVTYTVVTLFRKGRTKPNWIKYYLSEKSTSSNIFCWRFRSCQINDAWHECTQCLPISIYQNLILIYKAHTGTAPSIFFNKFSKINHNSPTSSKNSDNYTIPKSTLKSINFAISRRSPILWNKVSSFPLLKQKAKKKCFSHMTTRAISLPKWAMSLPKFQIFNISLFPKALSLKSFGKS